MIDLDKLQSIVLAGTQTDDADGVILPAGYKIASLEQELERHREAPTRQRGTFATRQIDEFVTYCKTFARDGSRIFLDPDNLRAICRINHGCEPSPEWGDNRATLTLQKSPEFAALTELAGKPLTQDELIDYVLDWAPSLRFYASEFAAGGDMEHTAMPAVIAAIRNIVIKSGAVSEHLQTDLKRERSLLESASVVNDPPLTMILSCRPYDGLGDRPIPVRLIYQPVTPPRIKVRIIGDGRLTTAMAEEFRDLLVKKLADADDDDASVDLAECVHIGTYN